MGPLALSALLDSGSARSLISSEIFKRIQNSPQVKKVETIDLFCYTATNEPMRVSQQATVHFKLGHFSWNFIFLISDTLHMDVILGSDFMNKSGLVLDIQRSIYYFNFKPMSVFPISALKKPVSLSRQEPCFEVDALDAEVGETDLSHLSVSEQEQVNCILDKYPEVLTANLGCTKVLEYDIGLNDSKPVRSTPYSLAPPKMAFLRKHVDKLLAQGVIQPSKSAYSSPAFLVPKGEDDFRMVIDYRKLNQSVDIEAVPLPDINTAFSWFSKAKYFCVLDLNSAYHQIPLSASSMPVTAFCTPWGLYEFTRVPFGLATGAQVLTRLGNLLFNDLRFKNLVNFLDDYVLYAETFEELLSVLDEVLKRFKAAGITINPRKLQIAVQEIVYLGHKISHRGLEVDSGRTRAIRDYPPPRDAKGIARFIGMINFYSKFIPRFAERAAPLNSLRRKGAKFVWGTAQQSAFDDLKTCIIHPPVLRTPDFNKEFILQTDGSSIALGAVLLQEVDGVRMPIAYASRTLTEQERKYCAYEIECLGVLFGCDKFRVFLEHQEFLLECDNQALSWLLAHPRQLGRIGRWVMRIASLKFRVQHIRGTANIFADALSRMFYVDDEVPPVVNVVKPSWPQFPMAHGDIGDHQMSDPELKAKILVLKNGELLPKFSLRKGVLCCVSSRDKLPRIVLPTALIPMVFNYYHKSPFGGHLGVFKTLNKIREHFIYSNMKADIHQRVRSCQECAFAKPSANTKLGKLVSEKPTRPLEKIYFDYMGPMVRSKSGNRFLLVCVDAFSKYVWFAPTRNSTSQTTIKELTRIFQCFGFPKFLASDNARAFTCPLFRNFVFNFGMTHIKTSPYHPQGNLAERVNRNLKSALIAFHSKSQTSWDQNLAWLQIAFNAAKHESHQHSPFDIMFAFQPGHPLSLLWSIDDILPDSLDKVTPNWRNIRDQLCKANERSGIRYNKGRSDSNFKVDDLVLVKSFMLSNKAKKFMAKLAPRWIGPYQIKSFVSPVSVSLFDPTSGKFVRTAHVSQLKPFSCK